MDVQMELELLDLEEEEDDDDFLMAICLMISLDVQRTHRWWVHDILKKRKEHGAYYHLVKELNMDAERFQQYFRVTKDQFTYLEREVSPHLLKYCRTREVISPRERLALCLRYVLS